MSSANQLIIELEAVVHDIVDARVEEQAEDAVRDAISDINIEGLVENALDGAIEDACLNGVIKNIVISTVVEILESRKPWWRRWCRSLVQFATPAVTVGPPT